MIITPDDYTVIAGYAADDYDWLQDISTPAKRANMLEFSEKVAEIFVQMCAGQVKGEF
ncbi:MULTISPECIES: hypothetical protein [Rahnella]|uniref:Uncharacterized protein n=1 Tax=Rahnella laticis TaxID=2787622 RepID=A0ABS0E1N4_9GAMM|nr:MULTISPECIES: hypothetical protein [Rahnella]MBF7978093.1 hypothetical protein [Rahnella laticis]MBF7998190.1 hypothetical protein [Rahnella sp. LAC-M12]